MKRLRKNRQGAYFFVIDAFIAASILTFTLMLIFNLFVEPTQTEQSFSYAHDFLFFITSTELRDYRTPIITKLWAEGYITNMRHTLSEQMIIFKEEGNVSNATALLDAAVETLPQSIDINVTLRDADTGDRTNLYVRRRATGLEETHLVARSVEYALKEDGSIYGPYVLQVEVWS